MKCKLTLGFPVKLRDDVTHRRLSVQVGDAEAVSQLLEADTNQAEVVIPFDTDVNFTFVDVFPDNVDALGPLTLSVHEEAPVEETPTTEEPVPSTPTMAGEISVLSKETVADEA